MQTIKVTKMNGCGNDFVIVDLEEFKKSKMEMSEFAIKICNRNFGIGADGLIIPKLNEEEADIGWYFYNSDGTTAQMCGNGMRCFARYVFDKKIINKTKFSVKTLRGIVIPEILDDGFVRVNMGEPILDCEKIPFNHSSNQTEICVNNKTFKINAISMGNPHCVIFTEENPFKMAKEFGPFIEKHELFPEKTNVEFVKIISKTEIDMKVYERGCGMTLACGTGACASVVACILNNLTEKKVTVHLSGGDIEVEWLANSTLSGGNVFLIGPSLYNFYAEFVL